MAPQKRSADEAISLLQNVDMVLMDVEGTTTPVTFVTDTLFPYVKDNIKAYITKHFDEDECRTTITDLRKLADEDKKNKVDGVVEIPVTDDKDALVKALVDNITWQMSIDRKTTALKSVQGHVMREAFKQGNIKAPLFDDVAPTLKKLSARNKKVCVFSSGSVEMQKLVFGHTDDGDLQDLVTGFYDTVVGPKKDSASYKKIAKECGVRAEKIIYLTDTPQEAAAAAAAGMKVQLVVRPGNAPLSDDDKKDFSCIESFTDLIESDESKKLAKEDNGTKVGAGGDANGDAAQGGDDDVEDDVEDDDEEAGDDDKEDEAQ